MFKNRVFEQYRCDRIDNNDMGAITEAKTSEAEYGDKNDGRSWNYLCL